MPCRIALKAAAVHASHLSVFGRCEIRRDILSRGLDGGDQAGDGRQEGPSAHPHAHVSRTEPERTFGWWGRYRRVSTDDASVTQTSAAMIRVAMIHLMVRRLIRLPSFSTPSLLDCYPLCGAQVGNVLGVVFQKWRSTEIDVTLGLILMVSQSQE
jgi:hypothetical protein